MQRLFSFTCVALLLAALVAGQSPAPTGERVRGMNAAARQLLALAEQESRIVRGLLHRIDGSDLLVMVSIEPAPPTPTGRETSFRASTRLLVKAGALRYVAVWISSEWFVTAAWYRQVALLAHELQHAVEIADDQTIVDQGTMLGRYRCLGREWGRLRFETDAALDVEARVSREVKASALPLPPARSDSLPSAPR